jgi:hypothetical protein
VTFRAEPVFVLIDGEGKRKRKRPLFRALSLGLLRFEDVQLFDYFFFAGAFFFAFDAVFIAGLFFTAFLTTFFFAAAIEASCLSE